MFKYEFVASLSVSLTVVHVKEAWLLICSCVIVGY